LKIGNAAFKIANAGSVPTEGDTMENLVAGSLRIDANVGPPLEPIRLSWLGRSADRDPSLVLLPYFKNLLATAAREHKAIEMHFERLEHFNSSTITAIIRLVEDARRGNIKLALVYDAEQRWQRLSLEPLRVFLNDLLELRTCDRQTTGGRSS
jgi:hypothetical protein